MKRVFAGVLLVALFASAYWWFSRTDATSTGPIAAQPENPARAERETWFGAQALGQDIQWRESGLGYRIIKEGTPPKPGIGSQVKIIYTGRLKDGHIFDQSETPTTFLIGGTIPGLSAGLQMLGPGGKAVIFIPPSLGYGNRRVFGIPPDSGLIFEVEVVSIGQ